MKVNNINSSASIYGIYNTMFQGSTALNSIRLNRDLFSANKAQGFQLGDGALNYVNNIKSASKDISGTLKELSGSAFSKKAAVSSDTDVMTVNTSPTKPSSIKETTVKIDQTAAGQANEGASLNAKESFGSSGTSKFSIDVGGKTTELSINVSASDTNSDVQNKMATAINNAGIDVKATVETDSKNGTSTLKLESTNTGNNEKSKFTVSDVTGNLASRTGVDEVSREARDAVYSVNGGETRTSRSNTVDLGDGLSVTFNKASDKEVKVSSGKDIEYAKSAVNDLVKSFNDLHIEATQRSSDAKAQNLASKMDNISRMYSGSLSGIGIGFNTDGTMNIDKDKLNAAAESGKLEQFFTENSGRNYGFTNQLSRLSDNVSQHTSNFVSKSLFGDSITENFSYSGFGELLQYNFFNAGSLFDYSF